MPEEEFEVIPMSPIRKLERRLDQMEAGTGVQEINKLVDEVIELIKANQKIVDDLVRANLDLRNEMARIPSKIDELLGTLNEFVSLLKSASQEEASPGVETMKPIADSLTQLVEYNKKAVESNQAMIAALDTIDKRLKRLYIVPQRPPVGVNPMMRRTV